MNKFHRVSLDPTLRCEDTDSFFTKLKSKVIGQDEALSKVANIIQTYKAGFNHENKPLAVMMFLGPTGTGKTLTVESVAECLFGNPKAFFKMDCGEFQTPSSVATLSGSPPGYLGFRTGEPYISQEKLDKYQTLEYPINIFLLDEVEKANELVLQLFLGVLDKAILKTNSGEEIDFSRTIIIMTSNLGAESITNSDKVGMGFENNKTKKPKAQIKKNAIIAMEKFFKPEFYNRIDTSIVFNSLTEAMVNKILYLELNVVRKLIFSSKSNNKFTFLCTEKVNAFILAEGFSPKYGARELRRVITKYITDPLASLMMSGQINFGDLVILSISNNVIVYDKLNSDEICNYSDEDWAEYKEMLVNSDQEVEINHDVLVARASESL